MASLPSTKSVAQGLGTDYEVIVLGAGVAGLAAAERLATIDRELKVLVLEARDRIGGRVHSVGQKNVIRDAELGAQSLTQSQGKSWPVIERLGLNVEEFSDGSLSLYPGMAALVRAVAEASSGRVQLDSEVQEVFWRKGLVGVKYTNRGLSSAVTCRRLIVALPAGVLRSGALAMSPALPPSRIDALEALKLDGALSLALSFPAQLAVLKDRSQSWLFENESARLRAFPAGSSGDVLLEAQFLGARADTLSRQPESVQLALAIRAFEDAFTSLPALSDASWSGSANWLSDRYSLGATTQAGTELLHQELAKTLDDTVFFAGDATAAPSDVGTVHGAYGTGERAAQEVAESLSLIPGSGPMARLDNSEAPILELL